MTKLNIPLLLFTFIAFGWHGTIAASDWAEAPAKITVHEFLDSHFAESMKRDESDYINSYSLVSFYPSSSPQHALVFIIQTWRDSLVSERDLKREIRKVGGALYNHFDSLVNHPIVKKRWNLVAAKENFIVKHVRHSDLNETLAVTIDGKTYFDSETIEKTSTSVKQRGGVWAF